MGAFETEAVAWVNVAGLLLDLAGAAVLAWGLFIDEDEALKLGQSYYSEDAEEQQPKLRTIGLPETVFNRGELQAFL
jgi:hypothetical protein